MSYILDALRKSEQQRQLGVAPRLLAVPPTSDAEAQPALLKYGLIAVVLIGAGVAIGGLHPWQQAQPLSAKQSTIAKLESRPRQYTPAPLPVPAEKTGPSEQEKSVQQSLPWAAVKPAAAPKVATMKQDTHLLTTTPPAQTQEMPPKTAAPLPKETATPRETTPAPRLEKTIPPAQEKREDAAPTETAQEQKVVLMAELPLAIRQELPVMSIPVHTYSSTPKERIVGINDRLLQEGDYLAPGLKLEQIAPDGLVFSYKRYLFRYGL